MNNKCFICGGDVIWQNDFSFEDFAIDGDGIVSIYICSECQAEYDIYRPFPDESEE